MSPRPADLRLYWETVRHLRPVQLHGRLWFRAVRPLPDPSPAPPLREQAGPWVPPARRRRSQIGPDTFRFLNEPRSLARHGWDDPALAKLWRYNLHYFDDLNAEGADRRGEWHRALIGRWIAENPPGRGTGWEPYPTSLRMVNWIKWARAGNALSPQAVHSLAEQARWLARRLEHHLQGNHLFSNAKALVLAGCFFKGAEADAWADRGMALLRDQLAEQILADGGHFELSPMYHALVLEDMLDLVNARRGARLPVPHPWADEIAAMRGWLDAMCHPDGEIAFFNDAAIGIAPPPAGLLDYADRLGFPSPGIGDPSCRWLCDSGYVRMAEAEAVALLDVGHVGPDHLPAHAHADTLSFELSLGTRRVIVNSGTGLYGSGAERQRQRGTAAHNTVAVDGADSSEVWSGFRVARRARPRELSVTRDGDGQAVACAHDGYRWLPGKPRHRRVWRFGRGRLTVADEVRGGHAGATALFHFHPELAASAEADGASGVLALAQEPLLRWQVLRGAARLEPSIWHPEFGVAIPSQRLAVDLAGGAAMVAFSWGDA